MNYRAATGPLVPSAPIASEMDQMFSDLGLDTFVSAADGGGKETPVVTPSQSSGSLSLADKHRMVRQQEQSQRLQNSAELVPKIPAMGSAHTKVQATKPKDLTSTLIDSNLNQIKSPQSQSGNNNWTTSSNSSNWATGSSNSSWNGNFAGFPAVTSPTVPPAPTSSSNNGNNWSALDNLLPTKPQKLPMNQMGAPLLMAHSAVGNGNNSQAGGAPNQLSQQDIMEFLG